MVKEKATNAANVFLKSKYKVESTKHRKIIFISKSNEKHFIEISIVTYYILEVYKMVTIKIFNI